MVAIKSNHESFQVREAELIFKNALVRSAAESVMRQQVLEQSKNGTSATATLNDAAMGIVKVTTPVSAHALEQPGIARPAGPLDDVYSAQGLRVSITRESGCILRACA